jgi:hypothetical protein
MFTWTERLIHWQSDQIQKPQLSRRLDDYDAN